MIRIYPKFKILMNYDIEPRSQEAYYRFVTSEFVPALRDLGLYLVDVHQTLWGNYPMRQTEFVAESLGVIKAAFASEKYQLLEKKFGEMTSHYSRKVIPYQSGFQL